MKIDKVLILGGTHGNETTGVYLIEFLKKNLDFSKRKTFQVAFDFSNPKAIEIGKRYVDYDLNRSFHSDEIPAMSYERSRADELKKIVTDKAKTFVIDLHTTTSNMKKTIIISKKDSLSRLAAAYVLQKEKDVFLLETQGFDKEAKFVNSISDHGLMIEIGPVAQNLLNAKIFEWMRQSLRHVLDAIDLLNADALSADAFGELISYREYEAMDFPRHADKTLAAMIHPERQYMDYQFLTKGDPLFIDMQGKTIYYEGDDNYPIFLNEAAYYEKGIAFLKTKKQKFQIK